MLYMNMFCILCRHACMCDLFVQATHYVQSYNFLAIQRKATKLILQLYHIA